MARNYLIQMQNSKQVPTLNLTYLETLILFRVHVYL